MRSSMVSSGSETVCCIAMAGSYEESNNFSSVVTFKLKLKKISKEIGLKHVYLQAGVYHLIGCFVLNILLHRLWGLEIETQKLESKYEHNPRNKFLSGNLPVKGLRTKGNFGGTVRDAYTKTLDDIPKGRKTGYREA